LDQPQLIGYFLTAITFAQLGRDDPIGDVTGPPAGSGLGPIDGGTIDNHWTQPMDALHALPAIGGPNGDSPFTANDRLAGAFGSKYFATPLLATQRSLNGAKGRMFKFNAPTDNTLITERVSAAIQQDDEQAADDLLSSIQIVGPLARPEHESCSHIDFAHRPLQSLTT